jgi:hypothetical protein
MDGGDEMKAVYGRGTRDGGDADMLTGATGDTVTG